MKIGLFKLPSAVLGLRLKSVTTVAGLMILGAASFQAQAANIEWIGTPTSSIWDTTTQNWSNNGGNSINKNFGNGDSVSFLNSGTVFSISVSSVAPGIQPSLMTVTNDTAHNYTFNGGSITTFAGGAGTFNKSGAGSVTFNNTANFTGLATVSGGTLQIGNTGSFTSNGLSLTAGNVNVASGGTLNTGATTPTVAGGSLQINGTATTSGLSLTSGSVNVAGTLNSGTGAVGISSSMTVSGSLQGSGTIQVNNGGTLLLSGSNTNRIADNRAITLSGGQIKVDGASETLGTLTLSTSSSLDLSTLGGTSLTFASISGSGQTLNVYNFTQGQDHLFLGQPTNATIVFYSGGVGSSKVTTYQAEVVPEPSTILAGIALVGFLGWRERRRISLLFKREQGEEALATA